jgi:hypothetical protein
MMTNTNTEARIAKLARRTARLASQLRQDGEDVAAEMLVRTAQQAVEMMRAGRL